MRVLVLGSGAREHAIVARLSSERDVGELIAAPGNPMWLWPEAFLQTGMQRLVALNRVAPDRADATLAAFEAAKQRPGTRMCTPGVLEIIARVP